MTEIQSLGNIDIQVLTKEFVKIQTDEIIVTNETSLISKNVIQKIIIYLKNTGVKVLYLPI